MTNGLWKSAALRQEDVEKFVKTHGVSPRIARLLLVRGIDTNAFSSWAKPTSVPFVDPYEFHGMDEAIRTIETAIRDRTRIAVIGDYDVDGVSASVIMCETLKLIGAKWTLVIPHRVNDGYGISENIVDRCLKDGARVLVTVDNGINAHDAISHAAMLGMTIIVTDHHTPVSGPPKDASAVVHWLNSSCKERLEVLSGAAVAWKLSLALLERFSHVGDFEDVRKWHLGLAAMAALADVMPMTGENRRLVRDGLETLSSTRKPGFLALLRQAEVSPSDLTETSLLWRVTPRLNAAGRMDSATLAVDLLMTDDEDEAGRLASVIEIQNTLRREMTDRVLEEAMLAYERVESARSAVPGLVLYGDWPLGVVGIVAAKMSDVLGRPTIILSDDGSEVLKGSGRAPEGFPLYDALVTCEEWLHHFGGHESAAGCGVLRERVAEFTSAFEEVCAGFETKADGTTADTGADMVPVIADDWLPLSDVSLELVSELEVLRPYGTNAPQPSFFVGPVLVESVTRLSGGKHLRITVSEGNDKSDLLWFQVQKDARVPEKGEAMAAVVTVDLNRFRGRTSVQLRVKEAFVLRKEATRRHVAKVYALLRERKSTMAGDLLAALPEILPADIEGILATFVELGFAGQVGSAYHVNQSPVNRHLQESIAFQRFLWKCACVT